MATEATHITMIVFDGNYIGPEGYHGMMTGMMAAIGHGVCSCLCVFLGVWREHKKREENKIVNRT